MSEQSNVIHHVAVVGSSIGQYHIAAYNTLPDRFEVVALCDIDEAKGRAAAEYHAIPRFYNSLDDLCRADDVDIIDICTPSHLHFTMARQVLAAGKYAVIEKPVAGSLAEIDKLIEDEAASEKRVMPIFRYRFGHGL